MTQEENASLSSGCSKRPDFSPAQPWRAETRLIPCKAAASEVQRRTLREYVEDFGEPRTKLAGFFSILLAAKGAFGRYQLAFDDCSDRGQSLRRGGFKPQHEGRLGI